MRYPLLCISLLQMISSFCQSQIVFTPFQNSRPDTITRYVFTEKTIPVKEMPDAKAVSIVCFKVPGFTVAWLPVFQTNIQHFVSLNSTRKQSKPIDTLFFQIGKFPYTTLVFKDKRGLELFSYREMEGEQDVFVTNIRRKKQLKQVIAYLESNL
jgi:hypothetical protein